MKKEVLLIGGGGHARSIIDSLNDKQQVKIIGILDKKEKFGEAINGIPVIGTDDDLEYYYGQGVTQAIISLGSIGIPRVREMLYKRIKAIGYSLPNVIDDTAVVANDCLLGEGIYVGKGAIVNTGVKLGNMCIVNTGSIIEHDCKISDLVHIAPGVTLCGGVKIGEMCHIGAGATIMQYTKVGKYSVIGLGSVVVKDISQYTKAYGNPCKEVSKIE